MAKVLYCDGCQSAVGALVIETKTLCAVCRGPVYWREMDDEPFTLTLMDRRLLRSLRIRAD